MQPPSTASINRIACALLLAVFALHLYRAATQSITTAEAVAFDRWVRPPLRDILPQPYDPANHVLSTLLIKRSVALFRLSEFSFRLPELLGVALYLWAAWRLSHRFLGAGPLLLAGIALFALVPPSLPLAFFLWAVELILAHNFNLAGACLGLSAAADVAFLWPAAALGIAFLAVSLVRQPSHWVTLTEQFLIPSVATAFVFLAIPLSHLPPGVPLPSPLHDSLAWPRDTGARALVQALRSDAAGRPVEIGASPNLEPVLSFYRARYRLSNWELTPHKPLTANFDYYVLSPEDAALVAECHLLVIYHHAGLLLALRR